MTDRIAVTATAAHSEVIEGKAENWSVATMLPDKQSYEVVDAVELAQRWRVPVTWVREQTRDRATDPLPCVRLGRYVRFEWGSPKLAEWWEKRRS